MTQPVNLMDLGPDDFQKFLDSFDYVFSDCDGELLRKYLIYTIMWI